MVNSVKSCVMRIIRMKAEKRPLGLTVKGDLSNQ